jgi:AcrR family transcriptional regulator
MRSISNRDYVIQVGADLFLKSGFACTSMDDVVKQSKVSKSNIYYHFKSKDELALAVLEYHIAALQRLLYEQSGEQEVTLLQRIERYTDLLIQELVERDCAGGCPLISLMVEAGKTNESVRARLDQFFQQQIQQITLLLDMGQHSGEIRGDLPARALAALITSWVEGMLMLASIQRSVSSLREERDALLHMFQT